jgi:CHAD domain-containing protein
MNWEAELAAALKRQWKRYRRALKRCKAHFSEKAVHNSRVESRRLMAQLELLGIFAPARLCQRARRALKRHLACFNALRDTQVQLLLLDEPHRARSGAMLLRPIWRRWEQRSLKRAVRNLRDLKTRRLKRLVVSLERQLEASSRDPDRQVRERKAILHAVNAAHLRVLERRRHMDPGQVATLHRTRVALKKLRYMIEALQPLFPEITKARLERMQAAQTLFGELQDTDVFLGELDRFIVKHPEHATQLAPLRHWLLRRRTAQIQRCLDHGSAIEKFWPLRPG